MSKETLKFRGVLVGHSDWVTAIATPVDTASNIVISASRCVPIPCVRALVTWSFLRACCAASRKAPSSKPALRNGWTITSEYFPQDPLLI